MCASTLDWGGICSDLLAVRSVEGVRRGEGSGDGLWCSRFTLLAGGEASAAVCSGEFVFELERCVRVELGSWMPSDGNDKDFLLVLYGMVATGGRDSSRKG